MDKTKIQKQKKGKKKENTTHKTAPPKKNLLRIFLKKDKKNVKSLPKYDTLPGFSFEILNIALGLVLVMCPSNSHEEPSGLGHEKYTTNNNNNMSIYYVACYWNILISELYGFKEGNEMFYLTMHSTHFIYSYMVSDI